MGDTARFDLRYPGLTDAPNVPLDVQRLAEDVDGWLARAFPCTSGTHPSSPPDGFLIRETDTGNVLVWNEAGSSWDAVGGGGGGGGGGEAAVEGQWKAASAQSIPNATDTVLAFGTTETPSSVVERATSGVGHKFKLLEDGSYAVTAMARFASGPAGSRFLGLRNAAQTAQFIADQNDGGPAAATRNFSITKRFAANTELVVVAAQSSGASLSLVHLGTEPADAYVRLIIVKLTD